jgi:hypothetical protein
MLMQHLAAKSICRREKMKLTCKQEEAQDIKEECNAVHDSLTLAMLVSDDAFPHKKQCLRAPFCHATTRIPRSKLGSPAPVPKLCISHK